MVTADADPVLQLLRQAIRRESFPGTVLCASRDGEIRYDHALGAARTDHTSPLPLVSTALFDIASLTKPLATAASLMALSDAGEIEIDEPIATWLEPFRQPHKERITIRHLLAHAAGLPAHLKFYERLEKMREQGEAPALGSDSIDWTIQEIAALDTLPIGSCSIYSDLGYILLGRLIEIVAGTSLDHFCREQIFLPLGMEDTFFLPLFEPELRKERLKGRQIVATESCPWRKRVLIGEVHDDNCYSFGGVAGHAGLFSTAADIHRFALTLLRCSQDRASFFSPAIVREFWRIQELAPHSTWALGWDTPSLQGSSAGDLFSRHSVGHLGFTGCSLWIDRDESIIVVFLTNRVHPSRENDDIRRFRPLLHNTIYGLITKASPLPPPARMGAAPEPLHIEDIASIVHASPRLPPPPSPQTISTRLDTSNLPSPERPPTPPPTSFPLPKTANPSPPQNKLPPPPHNTTPLPPDSSATADAPQDKTTDEPQKDPTE